MEQPGTIRRERTIIFPNTLNQMMLVEELTPKFGVYSDIFRRYHLIELKEGQPFPRNEFLEGFDKFHKDSDNNFLVEFTNLKKQETESNTFKSERRYFCLNTELWIVSPHKKHEFNFMESYKEGETIFSVFKESHSKQFAYNHEKGFSFTVKKT